MCGRSGWHQMVVAVVFWCLMVSVSVSCCQEIWGGCLMSFSKGIWVLFRDTCKVWCIWGCIWVFRPCIVQQMLFFGKALKVKIPITWHFWNIKIPKPPYKRCLKIIGLWHFLTNLGPSEKNYLSYSLVGSPCIYHVIVHFLSKKTLFLAPKNTFFCPQIPKKCVICDKS